LAKIDLRTAVRASATPRSRLPVLLAVAVLAGCAPHGLHARGRRPLVVAHRGGSVAAPENTLAAFRTAIAHGVTAAECDVHLSADGAVVVIHDPTLDRTTNGTGPVAAKTLAELRALDAGAWMSPAFAGEHIPELRELLALAAGRLTLLVELKADAGLEDEVVALLAAEHRSDVILTSFDPERLARTKTLSPSLATLLLGRHHRPGPPILVETAVELEAAAVGVEQDGIDRAFVEAAHRAGLGVFAWTVNDTDAARRLAGLGVDGIITDQPDRIAAALDARP
jgi:glycerophosphoryl diester phosphodiesterase